MLSLKIDEELQEWIFPLSIEEHELLESSILTDGCRDPLVVWGGYLLDGHNRYEICQRHGIKFSTHEKAGLRTKADVKIWMIENQLGKRNATDFARVALALKLKPLLEQRSKERQATSTGGQVPQLRLNSDAAPVRTDEGIAKAAGVGRDTVRKVEKIIEKATPDVIEKVRTGAMSINAAAKTVAPLKAAGQAVVEPGDIKEVAEPENYGPSDVEVAQALAAEADQLNYIQNLLANEDDPLTKALADVARMRLLNSALKSQNDGYQTTIAEQIRMIKSLRAKLAKLERAA